MAAVNNFRTLTQTVGLSTSILYTAPAGYTGVVLLSQVTNKGSSTHNMSYFYRRSSGADIDIVRNLSIPAGDTANLLNGKLVIESGDKLGIIGNNASDMDFIASVMETSNL
jgi:hypothetical protein